MGVALNDNSMVIELKRVTTLIPRLFCRGEMEEKEEEEDGRRTSEQEVPRLSGISDASGISEDLRAGNAGAT